MMFSEAQKQEIERITYETYLRVEREKGLVNRLIRKVRSWL